MGNGYVEPLKTVKAKIVDGEMVYKIDDSPWSATIPGAAGHEVILNLCEVPQIKIAYVLEFVPDSTE